MVHASLLAKTYPQKLPHALRQCEYLCSRLSLLGLLKKNHPGLTIEDLNLNKLYQIENIPDSISISHTKSVVAVSVGAKVHGVDIEWEERVISEPVLKLISHHEEDLNVSAIKRWGAKEAAFKMLFAKNIKVEKFSQIIIKKNSFSFQGYQGQYHHLSFEHEGRKLLVCLAF